MWNPGRSRDHVKTVPDAIDEIHVSVPAGAVHHLGTCRAPAGGVCRQILRTPLSLGLDDAPSGQPAAVVMQHVHADQGTRHREDALVEEGAARLVTLAHRARW